MNSRKLYSNLYMIFFPQFKLSSSPIIFFTAFYVPAKANHPPFPENIYNFYIFLCCSFFLKCSFPFVLSKLYSSSLWFNLTVISSTKISQVLYLELMVLFLNFYSSNLLIPLIIIYFYALHYTKLFTCLSPPT